MDYNNLALGTRLSKVYKVADSEWRKLREGGRTRGSSAAACLLRCFSSRRCGRRLSSGLGSLLPRDLLRLGAELAKESRENAAPPA